MLKIPEIPDTSLWQGEHESQESCFLPDTFEEEEFLLAVFSLFQEEKNWKQHM